MRATRAVMVEAPPPFTGFGPEAFSQVRVGRDRPLIRAQGIR